MVLLDRMLEYNRQFSVLEKFDSGGVLRQHFLVKEKHKDYNLLKLIGYEKAIDGCVVDIMPILNEGNTFRKIICPDAKGNTNADLRIDGLLYEVNNQKIRGN